MDAVEVVNIPPFIVRSSCTLLHMGDAQAIVHVVIFINVGIAVEKSRGVATAGSAGTAFSGSLLTISTGHFEFSGTTSLWRYFVYFLLVVDSGIGVFIEQLIWSIISG